MVPVGLSMKGRVRTTGATWSLCVSAMIETGLETALGVETPELSLVVPIFNEEESVAPLIERIVDEATVAVCAEGSGIARKLLEGTVEYTKQRKQFGQPIGKFQSVSNRAADMKLRMETARLLLYKLRPGDYPRGGQVHMRLWLVKIRLTQRSATFSQSLQLAPRRIQSLGTRGSWSTRILRQRLVPQ